MTIRFAPQAEEDLAAALDYLLTHNEAAARALRERVFGLIERLAKGEFDGAETRLRSGELVRSWPAPPLRIFYVRPTHDEFVVLRLYHQARNPLTR